MSEAHEKLLQQWHSQHGRDGMYATEILQGNKQRVLSSMGKKMLAILSRYTPEAVADAMFDSHAGDRPEASIWRVLRALRASGGASGASPDDPEWLQGCQDGDVVRLAGRQGLVVCEAQERNQYGDVMYRGKIEVWVVAETKVYHTPFWAMVLPSALPIGTVLERVKAEEQKVRWRARKDYDCGMPMSVSRALGYVREIQFASEQRQAPRQKPDPPLPQKRKIPETIGSVVAAMVPGARLEEESPF